jgi:hypothetical protein
MLNLICPPGLSVLISVQAARPQRARQWCDPASSGCGNPHFRSAWITAVILDTECMDLRDGTRGADRPRPRGDAAEPAARAPESIAAAGGRFRV